VRVLFEPVRSAEPSTSSGTAAVRVSSVISLVTIPFGWQWPTGLPEPTDDVRREALVRYAAAGMTVLKNDGSLPLEATAKVALIGRPALDTTLMGGGSAQVNPPHQVTIAAGLTAALPGAVVEDGVEVRTRPVKARPGFVVDPSDGRPG